MSFRAYLLFMALATAIAWAGWAIVVMNVNPQESGTIGFFLFYITLSTGLIGALSLAGIGYRTLVLKRRDIVLREVRTSFRHALLLSAVSVISLILSAHQSLHWWTLFVLIACACVIEYIALVIQQVRRG